MAAMGCMLGLDRLDKCWTLDGRLWALACKAFLHQQAKRRTATTVSFDQYLGRLTGTQPRLLVRQLDDSYGGTIQYAAPEMWNWGNREPYERPEDMLKIDIFAFGSTLWEILAIKRPHEDELPVGLSLKHKCIKIEHAISLPQLLESFE